jgi:hypothetical protein
MSTAAELRKEQLKAELAVLETEEQQKKTLASELIEAENAANEASRLVQLNKLRLAEQTENLEQLSRDAAKMPQGMSGSRSKNDVQTQQTHQAISTFTVEGQKLEGELRKKECALGKIVERIAEHPAYKAVHDKQRWLVTEATKLARSIFSVPLDEVAAVLKKIETLADAENSLITSTRGALRSDGLPDLRPKLARFLQEIRPDAILESLPGARTQVFEAVNKINEHVSRQVLR